MQTALRENQESKEKKRVLVIDDDEFSLELISVALQNDYDLKMLTQGAQALTLAQEYLPNLIILDLNMPNLDGYEILAQFKSHPFLASIPVLCLSGEKSLEARRQIRELGAAGFLVKPVKKSQLQADIEQLLKNSNICITSEDNFRSFFIAYNNHEKEKAMKSQISDWLDLQCKVILITLASGQSFCSTKEILAVDEDRLIFLQFKGSILSKLPFMEDLSPIMYDLEGFASDATKNYCLVVDDPDILLNIYEASSSRGHIFLFSELIHRNFSRIAYFSKKPTNPVLGERLNQLAGLLIGNL